MESDTTFVRSFIVGLAMCCDIACNYPLWIAAKRIGANLSPFPSELKNLYKGGGTLWLSLGPTTIVEDKVTSILNLALNGQENCWYCGLLSAATSGMVAAVLVTSQVSLQNLLVLIVCWSRDSFVTFNNKVEYLITASHTEKMSVGKTLRYLYKKHGLYHLLLPPGMLAMVGREVPFASALFYVRPAMFKHLQADSTDADGSTSTSIHDKIFHSALCGVATSVLVTPLSQAPSVIAAYQQGHAVTISAAVEEIRLRYGWKGFFRGLTARTFSLAGTFTVVPLALEKLENTIITNETQ